MSQLEIKTKQVLNVWYCSVTYRGYDHMEKGRTAEEAQAKMGALIHRNRWNKNSFYFSDPQSSEQIKQQERTEKKAMHEQRK